MQHRGVLFATLLLCVVVVAFAQRCSTDVNIHDVVTKSRQTDPTQFQEVTYYTFWEPHCTGHQTCVSYPLGYCNWNGIEHNAKMILCNATTITSLDWVDAPNCQGEPATVGYENWGPCINSEYASFMAVCS